MFFFLCSKVCGRFYITSIKHTMFSLRISVYGISICVLVFLLAEINLTYAQNRRRPPPQRPLARTYPRVHPCEHSSCYPATGNLLIGRENRLYASSTCGLRGAERFCIVSHLEEKKCFLCDTREETKDNPLRNHRIGNIIYATKAGTLNNTWWQSENGKENVTIQLDLEAEFHFTHVIIVFATFRPAAMLIERSYDFGKTWHVYRYFAHNCETSFPGVPTVLRNITDVICEERYSNVEPSRDGEVIFRVLPPNVKVENPYALHVQNMLKMTNFRINFTKLHNLGDTLLDDRQEIQEKYYYAIRNMVVRGSCSCYGHASRCLPLDGSTSDVYDMVHGRCECTHNTTGLNCEQCKDFYNDLPWKPALGKQKNACKQCNCNNHATSCHFDEAVYEHSGRVSGGVCDNCQHNTQGQHCEECIPFFYKDPNVPLTSEHVCKQCNCNPDGSKDEGICDSTSDPENGIEAGACHCKENVKGRRCDICKEGTWNLNADNILGCQNCTCNTDGTVDNTGCNMYTGECTCKRFVTGRDCNQCLLETYGLSAQNTDGCKPCNCDPGGSYDNYCDVISGQCRCRPHMTGLTCDTPIQLHYVPSLHVVYDAEIKEITECISYSPYGNCTLVPYQKPDDREPEWTGPGYQRLPEKSELEITADNIPRTMTYDVVVRYMTTSRNDWEDAKITIVRPDEYDPNNECANSHPSLEQDVPFYLPEDQRYVVSLKDICLEKGKVYKFRLYFERQRRGEDNPAAQIMIDSLTLVPRIEVTPVFHGDAPAENRRREYDHYNCNQTYYDVNFEGHSYEQCKDLFNTVSTYVYDGATSCECHPTGSKSKHCELFGGHCPCKPNVVGRKCDMCAPSTYGFGPEGCTACDCNSIGSKDNACDLITGQCKCHPNTYGRECDQCQPGFWNFPNCQMCQCNGHAQLCDSKTGQCLNCMDFTTGYNCELCLKGYYGNPLLGNEIGCRPCRCPDTVMSGHSHAEICELDRRNNDMICHCKQGYSGARCDVCDDNYFGNPETPGGSCEECNCNNNVNPSDTGNCDGKTGKCLKCLYDTTGDNCEHCRDGYYGDALLQNCRICECNILGTNGTIQHCDRVTGQCPCLMNVRGIRCDECIPNHWKIASGEGCEPCDCDPIGSESEQCHPYEGQCQCKPGFGGRKCDQCQAFYWGDPNIKCHECNCDVYGSANAQCNRETGECVCHPGIGGYKCDVCARGYLGEAPYCKPCGECFDNWDDILRSLEDETKTTIERAKQIKTIGATGAYSADFTSMDNKLKTVQQLLDNTTVSLTDIEKLDNRITTLRDRLQKSKEELQESEQNLSRVYVELPQQIELKLEKLRNQREEIKAKSSELKENGIQLQETNIEGALNLTQNAMRRVTELGPIRVQAQEESENAERQCKRTETWVNRNKDEFEAMLQKNNDAIDEYQVQLVGLNEAIPDLNSNVCDKRGNPCDSVCGGAGCNQCGGISCENGALTRADKALKIAKDVEQNIMKKKEDAEIIIRSLAQAKQNASEAYIKASEAFEEAERYLNRTNKMIATGDELVNDLNNIINNQTASPESIEELAEKTINLDLQLEPEEISKLGKKINEAVASLKDVETIIENTRHDLYKVERLKEKANNTKTKADEILNTANSVVKALEDADTAQEKAQAAIKKANSDILSAKEDLEKIDSETNAAHEPARITAEKVESLADLVDRLRKRATENEILALEIKRQADKVKQLATDAHESASQLKNKFQSASSSLSERANSSEVARERAQNLLQRASKLTVDTNEKIKELEGMNSTYVNKEKQLQLLKEAIQILNEQMKGYFETVSRRAEKYRTCTA
ncbi:laminin subunit beta-1 isoform X2 [Condylostylus longicornis]|uniref:laminin subunit beta-1 isoform X2 n=2 Tax=Condylostylus longicornis TaxID=2530218 RepID=UPI00244DB658|nr:laminin subunit beta-1 isoform X2 [Condylostylus longicornis]